MKNTKKIFFTIVGLLVVGFFAFGDTSVLKAQSSVSEMDGNAWSNTNDAGVNGAGWISFKDQLTDPASWGVTINSTGDLSGYAWANPHDTISGTQNFGWVKFGGLSGFPAGSGTTASNARLVGNNIIGWARFCSATLNTLGTNVPGNCSSATDHPNGGWDGWISFKGDAIVGGAEVGYYGVSVGLPNAQGERYLSGFAWGGPLNVGWIDMSRVFIKEPNSIIEKSKVTFVVAGASATMITPVVSAAVSSGTPIAISWNVNKVTNCQAGGEWNTTAVIARNSTDGNHIWPTPPSFNNTTNAPVEKKFLLTCQGDEFGTGSIAPITREVKVIILPAGNVASVVVIANPKSVPDSNGQMLTNLTWIAQNVQQSSCKGFATLNGTELVIPKWSSYFNIGSPNPPYPGNPGVFNGLSGFVGNVMVAGSVTSDTTEYGLVCIKSSGAVSPTPCMGQNAWVCGNDTVTIKEPIPLFLTAHTNTLPNSAPINSVNPGEKITLKWRSIKDMECSVGPSVGASSVPATNWAGYRTDLDLSNARTASEDHISVIPAVTTYSITCRDKNTSILYSASTFVSTTGTSALDLSLTATDEASGFGTDGLSNTVVQGGTVKVDIKKLAGDFVPGNCVARTYNVSAGNTSLNTTWNGSGVDYDPDGTFPSRTTGGVSATATIEYEISCIDDLNGLTVTASDQITIIPGPASNINVDLKASLTCIEPGQDFALNITSTSTLPPPVGTNNDFTGCTTTGPGPNAWTNFPNSYVNSLNVGGGASINVGYSTHNTPAGGTINYSITCEDSSNDTATDIATVIVADDCSVVDPPDPTGSGNIKPIIEER